MKRVWRWLFNFAAALSMVMWLGTVALWALVGRMDHQWMSGSHVFDRIYFRDAGIVYFRAILEPAPPKADRPGVNTLQTLWRIHVLGAGIYKEEVLHNAASGQTRFSTRYTAWIKLALPTVVLAGLPIWWIIAALRTARWRKQAGFCDVCGYDLRATPERCPECGTMANGNHSSTIPGSSS